MILLLYAQYLAANSQAERERIIELENNWWKEEQRRVDREAEKMKRKVIERLKDDEWHCPYTGASGRY